MASKRRPLRHEDSTHSTTTKLAFEDVRSPERFLQLALQLGGAHVQTSVAQNANPLFT